MYRRLRTDFRPIRITAAVQCDRPVRFRILGHTELRNAVLIDRITAPVRGYEELDIPIPITSRVLKLLIVPLDRKAACDIRILRIEPMRPRTSGMDPEIRSYLDFAAKMALYMGALPPGDYRSPDGRHHIMLAPRIVFDDGEGTLLNSSFRIHLPTGRVEVSKHHSDRFTVPARFFLLLHEKPGHYYAGHDDEFACDRVAAELFSDIYGMPQSESANAISQVGRILVSDLDTEREIRDYDPLVQEIADRIDALSYIYR